MSFSQIIGQKKAILILKKEIELERAEGSYLFSGPEGVGKSLCALTFAKTLNCEKKASDSCDVCSSCRRIERKNHPDVHWIEPRGTSLKIDQIRGLKREIEYKSFEGRKKIWIVEDAHKLTPEAANSFLKILEEPPPETLIILITPFMEHLPSTIISRCKIVKFFPLSQEEVEKIVKTKTEEKDQFKLKLATRLSQGKVNEAIKILTEESFWEERGRILNLLLHSTFTFEEIFNFAYSMGRRGREKVIEILEIFLSWYRDLLWLEVGEEGRIVNLDYREFLKKTRKNYSFKEIEGIIESIQEYERWVERNVNPVLLLENLGLTLRRCRRNEKREEKVA